MGLSIGKTNLVEDDKDRSVCENRPDEDIGKDAGHETVGMVNHDGTVPVDGHKRPSQGP